MTAPTTSATAHTPGPWLQAQPANAATNRHPAIMSDAGQVAIVCWAGSERQTDANGRVLAEAADLRKQRDELAKALRRLLRSFPTDSDMREAQWEAPEINEACDAYDAARALIARVEAA